MLIFHTNLLNQWSCMYNKRQVLLKNRTIVTQLIILQATNKNRKKEKMKFQKTRPYVNKICH